jgi:16S rRNA processing protein RimM
LAEEELISIGKIVGVHGVRGMVRVYPLTDFPQRYLERPDVFVVGPDGSQRPARITEATPHKGVYLMAFDWAKTRDEAEGLVGGEVKVPPAAVVPLPEGSYYHFQLVGLRVIDESGKPLGLLSEVVSEPANDVYVVTDGGRQTLLPATREVIRRVDLAAGVIVARPLEEWK